MKQMKRYTIVSLFFLSISSLLVFNGGNAVFAEQPLSTSEFAKVIVCSKAFEALGRLENQSAKDVLLKGLKSNHDLLRLSAANALGELKNKDAVPALRAAVNDENYLVRIAVLGALVKLGDVDKEAALLNFLKDSDAAARSACVSTLRNNFGTQYVPQLLKILENEKSTVVRREIIETLADSKLEAAVSYVRTALKDPDPEIRQIACKVVYKMLNREEAVALLKDRLKDNNVSVRAEAKISLGELNESSLTNLFWEELEDKEPMLRASSFKALAKLKNLATVPVLLRAILAQDDSPAFVRMAAAYALKVLKPSLNQAVSKSWAKTEPLPAENIDVGYRIEGKNLLSLLIEALQNKKHPLYLDAPLVLRQMEDPLTYPALRKALYQDNPEIVASAAFALGEVGDKEAFSDLIQVCKVYGF